MKYEELPENMQKQIDELKHYAQTIQSDVLDALESTENLDEFAAWFKEQLRLEKESPEDHKIDQMVVLAHLTQLQFASTIPQSKKTNNEHCLWSGGVTTKQERTLYLIEVSRDMSDCCDINGTPPTQ